MGWDLTGLDELRMAVENAPHDSFNRCNLACALASAGAVDEALIQLSAAVAGSNSQITAGCVASAIRDVADYLAKSWSLPVFGPEFPVAA